jgi:outer membrane murein-binding lipoprotein Lpp
MKAVRSRRSRWPLRVITPQWGVSFIFCFAITGVCLLAGCSTLDKNATLRRDLDSMIQLLERGACNEMADQFVVASRVAEAKKGLKVQMNRQITLAVLKELTTKNATFSEDGQSATFQIAEDDIPHNWRFDHVAGRWRLAETF